MANKYFAKKTTIDGITFDSKKEAKRYSDLKLLEKAGKISDLEIQVPFELYAVYCANDIKIGKYILDFVYWNIEAGATLDKAFKVYEDVKGWDKKKKKWLVTPLSAWKKKHVEAQYGITVNYV